jgi:3',5'-cyclic-AMP phosphodiesterase
MKKQAAALLVAVTALSALMVPVGATPAFDPKLGPSGGSKHFENPGAAQKAAKPLAEPAATPNATGKKRADKPLLSFPVISDIHVQSWHQTSHDKLKAALNDLYQINPNADTLIINGDLTNGLPADYTKLKELMAEAPHPKKVFYTIGNHEFYKAWFDSNGAWNPASFPNGETEASSIGRFLDLTKEKKVYYDQTVAGHHFIFLGSEQYRQSDPANLEDAYLSKEQLSWLKASLSRGAATNKPIFVFLHQPLPYTVAGTHFCCVNNRAVVQHEELKQILSGYPQVIFFSGHSHWELKLPQTLVRDSFTMVNSSSVVQPWTDDNQGGEMLTAPEESEGLYVEVYPDEVLIQGRDFYRQRWIPEAQFSISTAPGK